MKNLKLYYFFILLMLTLFSSSAFAKGFSSDSIISGEVIVISPDSIGPLAPELLKISLASSLGQATSNSQNYNSLVNTTNSTSRTIQEDAEDDDIANWVVYDNDPAGATITNVIDPDNASNRAIKLLGDTTSNGFRYTFESVETGKFNFQWRMKYSESYTIYINMQTTAGQRYLYYTAVNTDSLGSDQYVHYGLGAGTISGEWVTINRNLVADLNNAQPGNQIISVSAFLIRGSGYIDDIVTSNVDNIFQSGFEVYTITPTTTTGAGTGGGTGATTVVYDIAEFGHAINNAQPGDVIRLADGIIIGNSYSFGHRFSNVAGTPGNPITITTSATNPGTITTANWLAGIPLSFGQGSKYIIIENIVLDGADNNAQQGLNIGGYGFTNRGTVHHLTLRNITVHGAYNAGIKIGVHSNNIIIDGCKIYDIGLGRTFGEGIYLGEGNDHLDGSNDIIIRNCEIYNTNAEAIDIKIPSYNILIENNYIHDINVGSQGAIVVGLNSNFVTYDINTVIRNNVIHSVTRRNAYDGNAIVVASGNTWIYGNTIWDIVSHAVDVYQDFNNLATNNVFIWDNTIWTQYLPRFNVGSTYVGNIAPGGYPAIIDEKRNIYQQLRADNYMLTISDFIGPITGTADAGSGPGSGFALIPKVE